MSEDAKAIRGVFLEEASEILADIERDLLDLETSLGNRTLVDGLFRHLHTLKGSAGVAGMEELAHYTHVVESMLEQVRNGVSRCPQRSCRSCWRRSIASRALSRKRWVRGCWIATS